MVNFVVRANGDWTRQGPVPAEDGQQLRNTLVRSDITSKAQASQPPQPRLAIRGVRETGTGPQAVQSPMIWAHKVNLFFLFFQIYLPKSRPEQTTVIK